MIAESDTKELIVPKKGLLRQPKLDIGRLFTTMAGENVAEDPFEDATKKIKRAEDLVSSLRKQYPKRRFPMRNRVFDQLEASCEKAKERMQRIQSLRPRSMGIPS